MWSQHGFEDKGLVDPFLGTTRDSRFAVVSRVTLTRIDWRGASNEWPTIRPERFPLWISATSDRFVERSCGPD